MESKYHLALEKLQKISGLSDLEILQGPHDRIVFWYNDIHWQITMVSETYGHLRPELDGKFFTSGFWIDFKQWKDENLDKWMQNFEKFARKYMSAEDLEQHQTTFHKQKLSKTNPNFKDFGFFESFDEWYQRSNS